MELEGLPTIFPRTLKRIQQNSLLEDPYQQFLKWFEKAVEHQPYYPTAMHLSTASLKGKVSSRVVLLKKLKPHCFIFFTNYNSRKGKNLADNPYAALNFFWPEANRQVLMEGKVHKIKEEESDEYFSLRPRESQLMTWASKQSQPVVSKEELDEALKHFTEKFSGHAIPRPPYWGGYAFIPDRYEFWQGGAHRFHDRFEYTRSKDSWILQRLSP